MAKEQKTLLEKIYDYSLEEIMGERFGRYSKSIIQDRALPDVRDGLKPVQRRILFAMFKDNNTYEKKTKKSAKAVGNIMGNYHPHGDSSIYEALVRMSQSWKMRTPFIFMQGNNGSIDGDPAAAMRYTEAKLSKISGVLLKDINKESVEMMLTYDDERLEPTVLPAHFPNLLVNGSNGISAGYATNIPTHNLGEVIDATIKRIDNPNCRLETIMEIIKGPDFPTGGIIEGKNGIKSAYITGRGKVVLKSKLEIKTNKGKKQIIIDEIPYDTIKMNIIKKIEDIRIDKKIDGIVEVRDESDKDELVKIVIDLKKDAKDELIVNYLLKNTDLQINYNFNMVAIVNRRPKLVGVLEILDAFIAHEKSVVIKRTEFDLKHAKSRLHIVEGLIKALNILDEVIKTIRKSKNKQDAILNLVKEHNFTNLQAEAIVMMQLYKLTNTDVDVLKSELENLNKIISFLEEILRDEETLKKVIKTEMKNIKKEYSEDRKTIIKDEITEIKIDEESMISNEEFIVIISNDGYIKKVSVKSYNMSESEETGLKEGDYVNGIYKINNLKTILIFTNNGNYLYIPVHKIPEAKYKDIGKHINTIAKVSDGEKIIKSVAINDFNNDDIITIFTKNGMVKRTNVKDYKVTRYTKPITNIKLKEQDEVINVCLTTDKEVVIVSKNGYALKYNVDEIPIVGLKTSGVKAINLKEDEVINAFVTNKNNEYITIFTDKKTAKRIKLEDITKTSRAKKGSLIIKSPKSKTYNIINILSNNSKDQIGLKIDNEIKYIKISEINIMDKTSVGGNISNKEFSSVFTKTKIKSFKEEKEETIDEEQQQMEEQEPKNMTMSDFFDEFKI